MIRQEKQIRERVGDNDKIEHYTKGKPKKKKVYVIRTKILQTKTKERLNRSIRAKGKN